MTAQDATAHDALDWASRVADPDFADWAKFTAWLEADAVRAEAYDRAVAALDEMDRQVRAVPTARPEPEPVEPAGRSWTRPRWIGAGVAAALAVTVGVGMWTERAQPYAVETAPGRQRTVALADGSRIVLAGGSRVELDRSAPRYAAVVRGEMLFQVRHDAARPFRVRAGALEMTDLGTVFDVKRAGAVTRVAVAEGAVLVDPAGSAVRLDPGQAVIATGTRLERRQVAPAEVGGWRDGWLAFDDATLAEVASDLSRHLARPVSVAPAIAARTFRGTLDLRRAGGDARLLGDLLDVRVRQHEGGWTLEPRG